MISFRLRWIIRLGRWREHFLTFWGFRVVEYWSIGRVGERQRYYLKKRKEVKPIPFSDIPDGRLMLLADSEALAGFKVA